MTVKDQITSTSDDLDAERLAYQMKALIRAKWPERYGRTKPDLSVVHPELLVGINDLRSDPGTVDRANQLLKGNLSEKFKRDIGVYEFVKPGDKPDSATMELSRVLREINGKSRRDQLNVLLDEKWGPVQGENPRKPMIDRMMVDRLKAMIRTTWPDEFGASKKVIQFPRAKKRGAKKSSGPRADVVQFRCGRADFSVSDRRTFDIFVKDGRSARFAAAMVDFMRSPYSKEGDDWFVRGGVSIADYMDQLTRQGI